MLGEAFRYSLRQKAVWIKLISEKDLEAFLDKAVLERDSSPFSALEKWMECMGSPPSPVGLKIQGVPLHVWDAEILRLMGNCLGRTVEVDCRTSNKKCLEAGRVKVLLDRSVSLTNSVPIWAEEVKFNAIIDRDEELVMNVAGMERQRESANIHLK